MNLSDEARERIRQGQRNGVKVRNEKAREKYRENSKQCLNCGCEISYEKRMNCYCGKSCAAIINNHKHPKRKISEEEKHRRHFRCLHCGKENCKSVIGKYCDRKCQQSYQTNLLIQNWKEGKISGITGKVGTSKFIRDYLFKKYESECAECGWAKLNPTSDKIPLQIEHINGQWDDNREENLTLLCPNCHSLTPTFGALNWGNGRKHRKNL
jgi:hypothetical protein